MQDPANMPPEVIRQVREMKPGTQVNIKAEECSVSGDHLQASTVCQFHSIFAVSVWRRQVKESIPTEILHAEPLPMPISIPPILLSVVAGAPAVIPVDDDMLILIEGILMEDISTMFL